VGAPRIPRINATTRFTTMPRLQRALHGLPLLTVAMLGAPTVAQNLGMPAGSRSYIELAGNWVAAGTCCDEAIGAVGLLPDPAPNYVGDPGYASVGGRVYANADATANRIRSSYSDRRTDSVFLNNSMVDTYSISGPAGSNGTPVGARMIVHLTGTLYVGLTNPLQGGLHVGGSFLELEVGTWNPSSDPGALEQFRVNPFDTTNFVRHASIGIANWGNSTPTLPVDLVIDQVLTETVGTPFDIAYGLNISGNGAGNISESPSPAPDEYMAATIDWVLPQGYQITSVLGWSAPVSTLSYCTAGTTTHGCAASIAGAGVPSASSGSGFTISASNVEGAKQGLFFYGLDNAGYTPVSWGATSSYLCVKPPTQRTLVSSSGGTDGQCDGSLAFDWNAFIAGNPSALGVPFAAGQHVYAQAWFRDPPSPKTTNLSNALLFAVGP
jgi:hypothetical protein